MASGVAEGAKAGAAFGPWGAAAGALLGGAADIASSGGGPQLLSSAVDARSFMDGSGWTVSTGQGKSTGGDRRDAPGQSAASAALSAQPFMTESSQAGGWLMPLAALGMLVMLWRRST